MSTQKSYWGNGIFVVCVCFAALMVSFAFIASHNKTELVVKDYYKAEIDYQQRIEKIKNFNSLATKPHIVFDSISQSIKIQWPEGGNSLTSGKIYFYRPDKDNSDFELALKEGNPQAEIRDTRLFHGKWKMQMEWNADGRDYFTEHIIMVH